MCSVQESGVPIDIIKFDNFFIIPTLHRLNNFQENWNLGHFFKLDGTLQSSRALKISYTN